MAGGPLTAWSSDGRYLLDGSTPAGLLVQAGMAQPSSGDVNVYTQGFGSNTVWRLPLRDAGLSAILRTVNPGNQEGLAVAWRPDGRVVAAYTDRGADGAVSATQPITLYGCASGKAFATLHPVAVPLGVLNGQRKLLRWSPDGTHLLLFDSLLGTPLVWGPRSLA